MGFITSCCTATVERRSSSLTWTKTVFIYCCRRAQGNFVIVFTVSAAWPTTFTWFYRWAISPSSRSCKIFLFYAQSINHRRQLFQGRFKALLVDAYNYLLELVRYVHVNPGLCCMAHDPLEYPWSSYRAYLGEENLPWLTIDCVLDQLSEKHSETQQRYEAFVQDGLGECYRKNIHQGLIDRRILCDGRFWEQVADEVKMSLLCRPALRAGRFLCLQGLWCWPNGIEECGPRRLTIAMPWLPSWQKNGGTTFPETGTCLNRDVGTLSSALCRVKERAVEIFATKERMDYLKQELTDNL